MLIGSLYPLSYLGHYTHARSMYNNVKPHYMEL